MEKKTMDELKILCPFCNALYTAKMIEQLTASMGCETCGNGYVNGEIKIECSNCKKVVYVKEVNEYSF